MGITFKHHEPLEIKSLAYEEKNISYRSGLEIYQECTVKETKMSYSFQVIKVAHDTGTSTNTFLHQKVILIYHVPTMS